jgi:hypothetical protein
MTRDRPALGYLRPHVKAAWEALRAYRAWPATLLNGALLIAFLAVRWNLTAARDPVVTGDGHIWLRAAHEPILSAKFWLGPRPATLSLVYKLLGDSDQRLVLFQTVLGTLSWVALATVLSTFFSTPLLSAVALILLLCLGLTTPVLCWDAVIRSESIGLSTFIFCFAAVLGIIRASAFTRSRWRLNLWASLAVATAALTAFARETNAYLLPLLAMLALMGATGRFPRVLAPISGVKQWPRALIVALSFLAISLGCQLNTRASGRYAFSLMNVIFMRVLPSSPRLAYFREELAMPVSPALLERRSRWASADDRAAFHSPKLADFRTWIHDRGYSAYEHYLLAHPSSTAREAGRHFPAYVRADFSRAAPEIADDNVADTLIVHGPISSFPWAFLAFSLAAGAALLFDRSRRAATLALTTLFCASAAIIQTYVCYHGDAMELERHGMMIGTLVRLGVITAALSVAAAVEALKTKEY